MRCLLWVRLEPGLIYECLTQAKEHLMSWASVSLPLDTPFVACLSFPMALPESHTCLPARGPTQKLLRRRSLLIFLWSLLLLRRGPVLGDDENAIRGSQHLKWVVSQKRHRVFAKDSLVLSKTVPPKPSFHNVLTQHNKPWVPNAPSARQCLSFSWAVHQPLETSGSGSRMETHPLLCCLTRDKHFPEYRFH